jgi:tetratricopeptide (TPR) repeat protein
MGSWFGSKISRIAIWIAVLCAIVLLIPSMVSAQSVDFQEKYTQGRLFFRQKLYFDAVKALHQAVTQTQQGKKHFGAHYYLAHAYYWVPDIQKAMEMLEKAKPLIRTAQHREVYNRLLQSIKSLYSQIVFVPEVDPDEVGKVQIVLTPKVAFSHKHRERYFKLFSDRLKKEGGLRLDNKPIFLPKGDYEISIERDQCLKLGLFLGENIARDITIGDEALSLNVRAQQSCNCPSNQKIFTEGKRLYCACPQGTGWNKDKNICEVVKQVNPWPWIITGISVVAVGGTVAIIYAATQGDNRRGFQLTGPGGKEVTLW